MTKQEIEAELKVLTEDQLRQRAIMKDSDAHVCKCIKMGLNFPETYPEEQAAYAAANAKFHQNADRIDELNAMEPDPEPEPPVTEESEQR